MKHYQHQQQVKAQKAKQRAQERAQEAQRNSTRNSGGSGGGGDGRGRGNGNGGAHSPTISPFAHMHSLSLQSSRACLVLPPKFKSSDGRKAKGRRDSRNKYSQPLSPSAREALQNAPNSTLQHSSPIRIRKVSGSATSKYYRKH
jgi:hypothetical protein